MQIICRDYYLHFVRITVPLNEALFQLLAFLQERR